MAALAAVVDLGFAAFHLGFWRLFGWPASVQAAGVLNGAVTQTRNVMLTFVFLAYGGVLLVFAMTDRPIAPVALLAAAPSGACAWLCNSRGFPVAISPFRQSGWSSRRAAVVHGLAAYSR